MASKKITPKVIPFLFLMPPIATASGGRAVEDLGYVDPLTKRRSLKMEQIIIFGKPIEHYRVHINGKDFYFESLPIPPWLPQRGYAWIDDKFKLARLLQKENIPAPKSIKIRTRRSTEKAFDLLNKPLIIKPKNGSRGRHTTTNINTKEEAIKAYTNNNLY